VALLVAAVGFALAVMLPLIPFALVALVVWAVVRSSRPVARAF
jgi:heme/copper-type cytochrome/quinol oxidase subunit 4